MHQADIVTCRIDGADRVSVEDQWAPEQGELPIVDTLGDVVQWGTACDWIRGLTSDDTAHDRVIAPGSQNLIFARGAGRFSYHKQERYKLTVNLFGEAESMNAGFMITVAAGHGYMMLVCWAVLYPMGILVARHKKTHNQWIVMHKTLQSVGTAGAISMAAVMVFVSHGSFSKHAHAEIGLIMVLGLLVQIGLGQVHLVNLKAVGLLRRALNVVGGEGCLRRLPLLHAVLGSLLMLASLVQVPLGIELLSPGSSMLWGYLAAIFFWVAVALAAEVERPPPPLSFPSLHDS